MPYYEQPGRTRTTDKDGKEIVTVTYIGDQQAPRPPSSDLSGTIKSKSVTTDVAGQVRTVYQIELDAAATSDPVQTEGITVEVVSAVRTVPIEAHPNFAEPYLQPRDVKFIKDKLNTLVSNNDIIDFTPTRDADRAASLFGYLAQGIESYYVPSLVVRKTYQASSPPSAGQVGKIANPGVSIPGVPKGANFLLINVSARGSTGTYTVTEEYEMSGEGGWDTFLYGP